MFYYREKGEGYIKWLERVIAQSETEGIKARLALSKAQTDELDRLQHTFYHLVYDGETAYTLAITAMERRQTWRRKNNGTNRP